MEEKKNNKTFIIVLIGIIGVCLLALGVTYAYWILTREQTGENVVNIACLNITFTGENDITLDKAYPLKPEQLEKFLSTATPYHFTIKNECSDLASASINLESLTVTGKALEDDYIDVILYEEDYNTNLNSNKKLTENTPNDENKVITDAKHSYSLYNFTLKPDEERDFNLLLYMDSDTPMEDANMNATWEGKITLSAGYQEENTTIRHIISIDTNGMWGYKDKLTKIVIENKKSEKIAPEGGHVYGPFDESADGYGGVQSYVVCDGTDENCVGYLQGTNGIKGNEDSSNLFNGFKNILEIQNLSSFDTNNVTNMSGMFDGCSSLSTLDLSSFNTEKVTTMFHMFFGLESLNELDLSSFNTSKVNNMEGMFWNVSNIETLNISNFDTSNVTRMSVIFLGMTNLKTLDLSNITFPSNCSDLFFPENLQNIILKNVDTSHVSNMFNMFNGLSKITSLDLSDFDTRNVTSVGGMFTKMTSLETLNLSNWFFTNSNIYAFSMASNLHNTPVSTIILDNVDTSSVTNMSNIFSSLKNITRLDLSDFDTSNVTNFDNMFSGSNNLQSLTFGPKFVHIPEASTSGMFTSCPSLDRPTDDSWQDVSFD